MIVRTLLASLVAVAWSTVQVAQPGYWDELYAESLRMNVTDFHHSWQGVTFEKLAEVLGDRLQLREDLTVLVLGSGDSLLPEEIHRKGVGEVIAMDLSPRLRPRPAVRSLTEDARAQTSLEASTVDVIIELGLLDVILAEADVEGAAALLREARRLLCAGGLFISGSTDIPKFRQPLLAEHPAGGWAEAEVLRLDRPLTLDRRVKELDPSWEVDRIFIYLNLAAGEVEVGQAKRPARTEATTAAPPPTADAAAPAPEAAAPPAAPVEAAAPAPEAAAAPAAPVEAAAPAPEAAAAPAAPVEAAAPSPEAAAPPAAPVEAAAPSPEAAAPPAAPVEAAAPAPEAAAPAPEAAAPPAAPVEAAAPAPEAAAPPAAPVEAAAPAPEPAAPPAAPEAAAPASSPKSRVEDPAAAFAESIRRLQAQAAALANS